MTLHTNYFYQPNRYGYVEHLTAKIKQVEESNQITFWEHLLPGEGKPMMGFGYRLDTFLEGPEGVGLDLHGGVPRYKLTAATRSAVKAWVFSLGYLPCGYTQEQLEEV